MLLILLIALAGLSLVTLIIGAVTTLIRGGRTQIRSGPEVGAEIMSGQMADDEGTIGARRSVFVGNGVSVERSATISFANVKQHLASGDLLPLLPALLVIGGFVGLLLFGALAVLVASPNIIGIAVTLIVLYTLMRMLIDFIRA